MPLNLLLVNPNRKRPSLPPIGLDYLFDAVKSQGHQIKLFDFGMEHPRGLKPVIEQNRPDVIGITVRNLDDVDIFRQQEFVTPLSRWINTIRKITDVPIVLGGIGFSFMPREVMERTKADFGIIGDGEQTFPLLLDKLSSPQVVPNLYYREQTGGREEIRFTFREIRPFEGTDTYSRAMVDNQGYYSLGNGGNIQSIRGCNYRCVYCPEPQITGRKLRPRDPEKVVDELEILADMGIDQKIFFVDSEFNLLPGHSQQIVEAIIKRGVRVEWSCTMMPGNVSFDLLSKMKKAGCGLIIWSTDTVAEVMTANLRKDFGVDDVFKASEYCDRAGLAYHHNLLFGGPGEEIETIDETFHNIEQMNPDFVGISAGIRIYPNTQLHQIALKEGVLSPEDSLLYPVYYKEEYVKKRLWPYLIKKFGGNKRYILNGVRIDMNVKKHLSRHLSV